MQGGLARASSIRVADLKAVVAVQLDPSACRSLISN